MNILLSRTTNKPIYEQIKIQIKQSILRGEMVEGESLPSMRELAKNLEVSVITTKRAYVDLEAEGYVTSFVGKGTFVAKQNVALLKESKVIQIEEKLSIIVRDSKMIDLSLDDLQLLVEKKYKEELE
ncbi:MAG: GntR family transcriptional regulator [Alkalibacterium sp.]|uniref:GntR family transcriptional regulator n=1 Tax=Alkalibacterium sp. TaxID=1872447 RepID=UPI003970A259